MYLAKISESNNLSLYLSLFKRLASGQEIDSKNEIIDVIKETKNISLGEKDIYDARDDYYYLVSYLLSNGKDFLSRLDAQHIDRSTFEDIVTVLNKESAPA